MTSRMSAVGPHGARSEAHRPVVMASNGMVASGHPMASQAGIWALQRGGNAVDAAIAIAAALGVVEPMMSGLGGDGFIMIHRADQGTFDVVNATGAAPAAATQEAYSGGIPMKGPRSVSIPALIDGWRMALERDGTMSLATLFEPAIDLAENGFPITAKLAAQIADDPMLLEFPTSRAVFAPRGTPLAAGQRLVQRDLAATLRLIGREGTETFYRGDLARRIGSFSESAGGLLTATDLASCHARWEPAIHTSYHGYEVYEAPPNSSGHVLLQELNVLENFDLRGLGFNSAAAVHLMIEAKRLAFADREAYMADPDHVDVPIAGLLSKEYARERAQSIELDRAMDQVTAGDPWSYQSGERRPASARRSGPEREDTTCFAVVDRWGNAVCQLQSIQSAFGSALIAGDTGILLNNRMTYWHLDPNHVDCLVPGKRVRHTMNPVMATRDGRLALAFGTPGADSQVQTNMQVFTHVVDFGLTVTEAVEAPRWRHFGRMTESTVPYHPGDDELQIEDRFDADVRADLERRGHRLVVQGAWEGGGSEVMIAVDAEERALHGAADPRRDGYAIGY